MADGLLAGIGRATITPPLGTWLCGFAGREHGCDTVLDDLYATTLVLANDETSIAIITCDVCGLPTQQVVALRALIAERTGINPANVLINTSHTHSGPFTSIRDDMLAHERAYCTTLIHAIAGTVELAQQSLEACRITHGAGSVAVNVNRRLLSEAGWAGMGENLGGAIDRTVQLLRVDTSEGEPLAALVHYACHPVVIQPPSVAVSADFVGVARGLFEAASGATMLFLQGACGNINPIGQRAEIDMRERPLGRGQRNWRRGAESVLAQRTAHGLRRRGTTRSHTRSGAGDADARSTYTQRAAGSVKWAYPCPPLLDAAARRRR